MGLWFSIVGGLVVLASVVAACSAVPRVPSEASTASPDFTDPAVLVDWIATHAEQAGIAVTVEGEPDIASSVDQRFPLASTRKVLLLGAYAGAVADGSLDAQEQVPLADIERWYWPGTDVGAHPNAVNDWRARGVIRRADGGDAAVPLDEVVWAMIRWSDNAASDYVLSRVGADQALAFAQRHGMDDQEPLMSLFGEFVAWATHSVDYWRGLSPAERQAEAARLAEATSMAEAATLVLPSVEDQRALVSVSVAGTPSDWARLMTRIAASEGLQPAAADIIHRHLEWPLVALPQNRERFARFGAKSGSMAGVQTNAAYLQPHDGSNIAVALFFHDAPPPVEAALHQFADQTLIVALTDDGFRDRTRARLGGGAHHDGAG
jgi:D-alanyl-D-alanine carboxypeptidase